MQIEKKKSDSCNLFYLQGKLLGGPEAQVLMEEIQKLLDEGEKNVILNLAGIERMNSSGLGILMSVFTSFKNNGGSVKLVEMRDNIKKLFRITKLSQIFDMYDTEAEALSTQ